MVRKSSRKIVYTLTPQSSLQGHSLGVNSLAIDSTPPPPDSLLLGQDQHSSYTHHATPQPLDDAGDVNGILYSAGRDGSIIAWQLRDMNLDTPQYLKSLPASENNALASTDSTPAYPLALASSSNSTSAPIVVSPTAATQRSLYQTTSGGSALSPTATSSRRIKHKSISSVLSAGSGTSAGLDPNDVTPRLIGPALAAFLNSAPRIDTPTIPPIPPKGRHGKTAFKVAGPIHTNWVNDILLINDNKFGMFFFSLFFILFFFLLYEPGLVLVIFVLMVVVCQCAGSGEKCDNYQNKVTIFTVCRLKVVNIKKGALWKIPILQKKR